MEVRSDVARKPFSILQQRARDKLNRLKSLVLLRASRGRVEAEQFLTRSANDKRNRDGVVLIFLSKFEWERSSDYSRCISGASAFFFILSFVQDFGPCFLPLPLPPLLFSSLLHASVCRSQHAVVCRFKTFPCVQATRPHALGMWTFSPNTRKRFESTHGGVVGSRKRKRRGEMRGRYGGCSKKVYQLCFR